MSTFFDGPYDGMALAWFNAQLLVNNLTVAGRIQNGDSVAAVQGPNTVNFGIPSESGGLDVTWAGNRSFQVCAISGIQTGLQAANVAQGYLQPYVNDPMLGANSYFAGVANTIWSIAKPRVGTPSKIHITGHSAGGATAMCLARLIRNDYGTAVSVDVSAFGSPKPGDRNFQRGMSPFNLVRWMLTQDPVPLIPPSFELMTAVRFPAEFGSFRTWDAYLQPQGGVALGVDLSLTASVFPPNASITPFASLANWLFNVESQAEAVHGINTYAAWLTLQLASTSGGGEFGAVPRSVSPAEPSNPADPRRITQQERAFEQAILTVGSQQAVPDARIPAERAFVPVRLGRVWQVVFQGQTVAYAGNKRQARAFARQGNAWLNRMQTTAVVDANGLATQMTQYLAAASDPAGDFVPVMNTSVPTA